MIPLHLNLPAFTDECIPNEGPSMTLVTEAMLNAGTNAGLDCGLGLVESELTAIYRAMHQAAPSTTPPSIESTDEVERHAAKLRRMLDAQPRYEGDDPKAVHYRQNVEALEAAIASLTRSEGVEKLREALEPFNDALGEDDEFPDETPVVMKWGRTTHYALDLGHLRAVRAAFSTREATGEGE